MCARVTMSERKGVQCVNVLAHATQHGEKAGISTGIKMDFERHCDSLCRTRKMATHRVSLSTFCDCPYCAAHGLFDLGESCLFQNSNEKSPPDRRRHAHNNKVLISASP